MTKRGPGPRAPGPQLRAIMRAVAQAHGLGVKTLKGRSRLRHISQARQEFMWLAYATGRYSFQTIADVLGRDHTTVVFGVAAHAARKMETE